MMKQRQKQSMHKGQKLALKVMKGMQFKKLSDNHKYNARKPQTMPIVKAFLLTWKLIVWKTKLITIIDGYVRLVTMTLLSLLLAYWLNLSGMALFIVVTIGILIDIHDIAMKFITEKPLI